MALVSEGNGQVNANPGSNAERALNLQSSTSATVPKKSMSRTRSLIFFSSASLVVLFMKGKRLLSLAYGICLPFQKQTATDSPCSLIWSLVSSPWAMGM